MEKLFLYLLFKAASTLCQPQSDASKCVGRVLAALFVLSRIANISCPTKPRPPGTRSWCLAPRQSHSSCHTAAGCVLMLCGSDDGGISGGEVTLTAPLPGGAWSAFLTGAPAGLGKGRGAGEGPSVSPTVPPGGGGRGDGC